MILPHDAVPVLGRVQVRSEIRPVVKAGEEAESSVIIDVSLNVSTGCISVIVPVDGAVAGPRELNRAGSEIKNEVSVARIARDSDILVEAADVRGRRKFIE